MAVTFLTLTLATAYDFKDDYRAHRFDYPVCLKTYGTGSDIKNDYGDSIRLPPRMRGFGDSEYFETFIKPKARDSLNVRCVGRWPFGPGFEVYGDTVNNILCFGSGSGVLVFDISTPSNPVRLSQIAVNGLIMQIYLRDTLLFVSSYGNGIEVFNLANPSSPVKVSQISVPARDFCLKDTFAYCVAEDSLRIVNISDVFNPYQVGACWDSSYTISISGNYVYTGGRWKLSAIDVSNPANPQVVNSIPAYVYTLTVDGNHCYCVLNTDGFTIYNISDPMNIWQESQLNTVGGVDIYKLGFYVYLPGFVIVDVGNVASPFVVGDTSLPVYAQAVWVDNNFGYGFVANDYEGLTVININDPTNPQVDSQYYGADDSRDVFVQGNYAYVANWRKGLKIIDVGTPSDPFEVGEYDTLGPSPYLEALWVRDSIAYISVQSIQNPPNWFWFKSVNVNNVSSPSLIGQCRDCDVAADMVIRDSLAFVVGSGRIFRVVNISNPALPETLPRYYLPSTASANGLFIQDTFAYIADGDSGLRILNISNPAAPFEVGHFDNPVGGTATGIFVKDSLAYLASRTTGLRIVNVKNPSSPIEIGYHPDEAIDVVIKDTVAYVTSFQKYTNIINVSNPVTPTLVGYYVNPDDCRRLFVDSNLIYVTCYESGLIILEWTETGINEQYGSSLVRSQTVLDIVPNPIDGNATLRFSLPYRMEYEIDLFDIQGRRLLCLDKGICAVIRNTRVDLQSIPNGVYFIILKAQKNKFVKKIVVVH